jgi:hypothetical protein
MLCGTSKIVWSAHLFFLRRQEDIFDKFAQVTEGIAQRDLNNSVYSIFVCVASAVAVGTDKLKAEWQVL